MDHLATFWLVLLFSHIFAPSATILVACLSINEFSLVDALCFHKASQIPASVLEQTIIAHCSSHFHVPLCWNLAIPPSENLPVQEVLPSLVRDAFGHFLPQDCSKCHFRARIARSRSCSTNRGPIHCAARTLCLYCFVYQYCAVRHFRFPIIGPFPKLYIFSQVGASDSSSRQQQYSFSAMLVSKYCCIACPKHAMFQQHGVPRACCYYFA